MLHLRVTFLKQSLVIPFLGLDSYKMVGVWCLIYDFHIPLIFFVFQTSNTTHTHTQGAMLINSGHHNSPFSLCVTLPCSTGLMPRHVPALLWFRIPATFPTQPKVQLCQKGAHFIQIYGGGLEDWGERILNPLKPSTPQCISQTWARSLPGASLRRKKGVGRQLMEGIGSRMDYCH